MKAPRLTVKKGTTLKSVACGVLKKNARNLKLKSENKSLKIEKKS